MCRVPAAPQAATAAAAFGGRPPSGALAAASTTHRLSVSQLADCLSAQGCDSGEASAAPASMTLPHAGTCRLEFLPIGPLGSGALHWLYIQFCRKSGFALLTHPVRTLMLRKIIVYVPYAWGYCLGLQQVSKSSRDIVTLLLVKKPCKRENCQNELCFPWHFKVNCSKLELRIVALETVACIWMVTRSYFQSFVACTWRGKL